MLRFGALISVGFAVPLAYAEAPRRLDDVTLTLTEKPSIKIALAAKETVFVNVKTGKLAEYKDSGVTKSEHKITDVCNEDDITYTAAAATTMGVAVKKTTWSLGTGWGNSVCSEASGSGGSAKNTNEGTVTFTAVQMEAAGEFQFDGQKFDVEKGDTAIAVTFSAWPWCDAKYLAGVNFGLTGPAGALKATTKDKDCTTGQECFMYSGTIGYHTVSFRFSEQSTGGHAAKVVMSEGDVFVKLANFGTSTTGYVMIVSINPTIAPVTGSLSFTLSEDVADLCTKDEWGEKMTAAFAALSGMTADRIKLESCTQTGKQVVTGFELESTAEEQKALHTKMSGLTDAAILTEVNKHIPTSATAVTQKVDALPAPSTQVSAGERGAPALLLLLALAALLAAPALAV